MILQSVVYADTSIELQPTPVLPQTSEWEEVNLEVKSASPEEKFDNSYLQQPHVSEQDSLKVQTDFELIDLTLEGDRTAFEILVERYKNSIYALAFRMLRNHEDAADISQDVFFKAYEAHEAFN